MGHVSEIMINHKTTKIIMTINQEEITTGITTGITIEKTTTEKTIIEKTIKTTEDKSVDVVNRVKDLSAAPLITNLIINVVDTTIEVDTTIKTIKTTMRNMTLKTTEVKTTIGLIELIEDSKEGVKGKSSQIIISKIIKTEMIEDLAGKEGTEGTAGQIGKEGMLGDAPILGSAGAEGHGAGLPEEADIDNMT